MNPPAFVNTVDTFKSPASLVQYVNEHLRAPTEAGAFKDLPGYLDQWGRVIPILANRELWEEIGLPVGCTIPPDEVLVSLCLGRDASGRLLTRMQLRRMPREFLIPLPCELSEALKDHPLVGMAVAVAVTKTFLGRMESIAVLDRKGGTENWRKATTLSMFFIHGTNQASESHIQSHIFTFGPARLESGRWLTYENWACLRELHVDGGIREDLGKTMVKEAAKFGYEVILVPGKASRNQTNGCTVICPDGRIIHAGSVARVQSAGILASRAIKAMLGVQTLTSRELDVVLGNPGEPLLSIPNWRPNAYQIYKLTMLGILDSSGRIKMDLMPLLQQLDDGLAVAQASLADMNSANCHRAQAMIRNTRELLQFRVPEINPEPGMAALGWHRMRDGMLRLVASQPGGLSQEGWAKETVDCLLYLQRGGFLEVSGYKNRSIYSLSSKGKKQLVDVYCIESDIEKALACLRERLLGDQGIPEVNLGRLEMAGLRVHENQLVFVKYGRAVDGSPLLKSLGIDTKTETLLDYDWWRRLWDERHALPKALADSLMRPDEIAKRWPWLGRQKIGLPANKQNGGATKPKDEVVIDTVPEPRKPHRSIGNPHFQVEPHFGPRPDRARSI
ncbi:MAG: hypothetical protein LWW79_06915 [Holophagaceae bacterium]|nr:hypothetical protein [Holophagaceae bacterium]